MGYTTLGVLSCPRRAFSSPAAAQPDLTVVFVVIASQLSISAAMHLSQCGPGMVLAPILDSMLRLPVAVVTLIVSAVFVHFFAMAMGGRGDPVGYLCALGVSDAPWLFSTPLAIGVLACSRWSPTGSTLLAFFGTLALLGWSIGVKTVATSRFYGLSEGRALFVYFVAHGVILVLLWVMGLFAPLMALSYVNVLSIK